MLKNILSMIGYGLAGFLLAIAFRDYIGQGNKVVGESMAPTLSNGDYVITEKLSKEYEKGDIITVMANGKSIVKRIIATEGETVEIKDGVLYVNDVEIKEDYIKEEMAEDYPRSKVPKDSVFIMGDNRNNSTDSRFYGAFRLDAIDGKLLYRLDGLKPEKVE